MCVCLRLHVECREWRESGEWVPSQMERACGVSSCGGITLSSVQQRRTHTAPFQIGLKPALRAPDSIPLAVMRLSASDFNHFNCFHVTGTFNLAFLPLICDVCGQMNCRVSDQNGFHMFLLGSLSLCLLKKKKIPLVLPCQSYSPSQTLSGTY